MRFGHAHKNLNPWKVDSLKKSYYQKVSYTQNFSHGMGKEKKKKPATLLQKINILMSTTVITSLGRREETQEILLSILSFYHQSGFWQVHGFSSLLFVCYRTSGDFILESWTLD